MNQDEKIMSLEREVELLKQIIELKEQIRRLEAQPIPCVPWYPYVPIPPSTADPYPPWTVTYSDSSDFKNPDGNHFSRLYQGRA